MFNIDVGERNRSKDYYANVNAKETYFSAFNDDTHLLMCQIIYVQVKPASLVSSNEKKELEAQKQVYNKIEMEMAAERMKNLAKLRRINLIYLPLMALTFVFIFWAVGLKNAELI